ncbi:hypothetical protein LZ578_08190 [Jeotgalibaca sp. MA1X17-3]|uniref:hypothetical protein n=1 Tax=Jeotgalibaca sp. MA1X17-3 TaxID=2908211 RepID=UPI001F36607D|nr:hypothetical protein [Jeotgalibaca sp. MA1X17-3]UJF14985.1 hypothetical protein LZ578_08190 [Jeotgalibaca sp. MA1X17-3]
MAKELIEVRLNNQHTKDNQVDEDVYMGSLLAKFEYGKKETRQDKKERIRNKIDKITIQ